MRFVKLMLCCNIFKEIQATDEREAFMMHKPLNPKLSFVNVGVFIFILCYGLMYPLMNDDLVGSNLQALLHHTIWSHIRDTYFNWSGRASISLVALLLFNKGLNDITMPFVNLVTAFLFIVLMKISYYFVFKELPTDKKVNRYILLTILMVVYFTKIYDMTELIGFKMVTIQYFWGVVLSAYIVFLYAPIKTVGSAPVNVSSIKLLFLFLLGIILGNDNEIIAASFLLFIFGSLLASHPRYWVDRIKSNVSISSFAIGDLLGLVILIIAPGNYKRKAAAMGDTHTGNVHYSIFEKAHILLQKYYQVHFKVECSYVALGLLLLAVALMFLTKRTEAYKAKVFYFVKLIMGFVLTLLILTPIAYYYEGWIGGRVTFIPDMLLFYITFGLVVLNLQLFGDITGFKAALSSVKLHWTVLFGVMALYFGLFLYGCYPHYRFNLSRVEEINNTPDAQNKDFVFSAFCPDKTNHFVGKGQQIADPIQHDPQMWENKAFAEYYNIRSVREVPCV